MIAAGTDCALHFLGFEDALTEPFVFKKGHSVITDQIQEEIEKYFEWRLDVFQTPLQLQGPPFQTCVWENLFRIPKGKTVSYSELAALAGRPLAHRAAASSCAANRFVIVIPCHRVITKDGKLGGYSAGLHRKKWLLDHERR